MNILAHLYLSGGINHLMLGNFMGDFVKGKQFQDYPEEIKAGIMLHREIDTFTDNHPAHKSSRDRFRKFYGLHSGIVTDILYDHFLAKEWNSFHKKPLEEYIQQVYSYIEMNIIYVPERLKSLTPNIISNNWLIMYKSLDGIERVLTGMSKKTSLPSNYKQAMDIITLFYREFDKEFNQIIADLHKMVEKNLYLTKFA